MFRHCHAGPAFVASSIDLRSRIVAPSWLSPLPWPGVCSLALGVRTSSPQDPQVNPAGGAVQKASVSEERCRPWYDRFSTSCIEAIPNAASGADDHRVADHPYSAIRP